MAAGNRVVRMSSRGGSAGVHGARRSTSRSSSSSQHLMLLPKVSADVILPPSQDATASQTVSELAWGTANSQNSMSSCSKSNRSHSKGSCCSRSNGEEPARVLRLEYQPVECLHHDLPTFLNVEQVKNSFMIFLADSREDSQFMSEDLPTLEHKQGELEVRMKHFAKRNKLKSLRARSVVILHRNESPADDPEMPATNFLQTQPPHDLGEKYESFVKRVQAMVKAREVENIHYMCNFDDAQALLMCILHVAEGIVERLQIPSSCHSMSSSSGSGSTSPSPGTKMPNCRCAVM
eukprot:gnl/TRDRNA2_/TRDRNA2_148948_c0_seq1.p1 gnl/TRDRNA2_/TRDRNA2_148948_c0~~gnl/TRDRNA2_/TRDRNA2_148948_c0_seq1.p1  ORF type:complete len:315 (-),score=54.63 gnl/TRDRNA2_/TRDRNA2_148948_c0_seq1:184-1059(-)